MRVRLPQIDRPRGRKWKRSDISPGALCLAIHLNGAHALELLHAHYGIPWGVLTAAVMRDTGRGWVAYGVSVTRPHLNARAQNWLAAGSWDYELRRSINVDIEQEHDMSPVPEPIRRTLPGQQHSLATLPPQEPTTVTLVPPREPHVVVDVLIRRESIGCGPDCPPEEGDQRQRVEGAPGPVAAFLRAVADSLDPPKRPTRSDARMHMS